MKTPANTNHSTDPTTRAECKAEVERAVEMLLEALQIDWRNDHNTQDTPRRVAKMMVEEVLFGRFSPRPKITLFPNVKKLNQLYATGPISVRSMCSHHFVPILGQAWVGIIPGDHVLGLSKFNRLVDWIMARPQIQEEATVQLADEIESLLEPKGLAVVVRSTHLCMTWRGVRESSDAMMTTSVMRGVLMDDPAARQEFFTIAGIKAQ